MPDFIWSVSNTYVVILNYTGNHNVSITDGLQQQILSKNNQLWLAWVHNCIWTVVTETEV